MREVSQAQVGYYNYYNTIMIATLYRDQIFYLPTFLDFRGRIYSKVSYLSYQGGDLARSFLEFYYPKSNLNRYNSDKDDEIFNESFSYIKQYAGNVFNLSKKSINDKEEWCDKFISELRDFYSSKKIFNLEGSNLDQEFLKKYLLEADEPFQFISVYFAIKEVVIKDNHNISLPILFDASCSGVQHLASLANDLTIAKMVNVVSSEETRNDFYSLAADYVREYILNIKPNNNKISEDVKNNLMKIKVNRSILKIPVMTISYNVGCSKHI